MENATNSFTEKIGNTTYIVNLKQSETAQKTLDEKIRQLVVKEVMAEGFAEKENLVTDKMDSGE